MFKAVQCFYSESRACVEGESGMSKWFGVEVDLNMKMDGVVREVNTRVWGRGVEIIGQS